MIVVSRGKTTELKYLFEVDYLERLGRFLSCRGFRKTYRSNFGWNVEFTVEDFCVHVDYQTHGNFYHASFYAYYSTDLRRTEIIAGHKFNKLEQVLTHYIKLSKAI